jgi:uncharacterized repeat protein (TIGR03803 family)
MIMTKRTLTFRALLSLAAFGWALCAQAQTFTTLASFGGGNGEYPYYGSLIQAANGNYYGTTHEGGKYGGGTVFEVTPAGKVSDIYNFCSKTNCTDGQNPWSALVLGSDGNFYGATNIGGTSGSGTIFKMTIGGKITTLYSFCPTKVCTDGGYPVGLVQASNGNFYGTTSNGGIHSAGTIFEITSAGKFKVLYSFCSENLCTDGYYPLSGPMQASNGNLYGTAYAGGAHSAAGAVYEITMSGLFRTLYSFCAQAGCADGSEPFGGLIQGSNGNLYGTTFGGGASGYGTVFEITTTDKLVVLHSFDSTDGSYPLSAPIQASDSNFYGTTNEGGSGGGGGTIYEITSAGVFNSLYSFCNVSACTGEYPGYGLGQATNGALIGTTSLGGSGNFGTVFSYATGLSPLVETVPKAAKVGARVIILGNGLTGSSSITFNGTTAAFIVVSDTEITATVPTGATSGTVVVTTPSGTLYSNPAFRVTK